MKIFERKVLRKALRLGRNEEFFVGVRASKYYDCIVSRVMRLAGNMERMGRGEVHTGFGVDY